MNAITLRKIVNFSANRKKEVYKLESAAKVLRRFIFLFIFCVILIQSWAQINASQQVENTKGIPAKLDSVSAPRIKLDTAKSPQDSIRVSIDSVQTQSSSDIKTTINYSANDSIKFGVDMQMVYLYGKAVVDYGSIKLEAEQIEIDWNTNTVTARGITDSLGNKIGMPVFHNGSEVYVTKGMKYNFDTGRAIISDVVTQQGDGYMHGTEVFKNEDNELFSMNNSYTTCNLEHPHYSIKSRKTKAIPDDKIVSGFFNLEINEVPTPLGFPFGMFPMQRERKSGIIFPTYGEERIRGFFLRDGGYYFDISDYVKLKLTGDIYTKGSSGLRVNMPYKKRYRYNGALNFVYTKSRIRDEIENKDFVNDFQLRWNHTPQSRRNTRFSANVTAATKTYTQNNVLSVQQNTNRKLNSSISLSQTFGNSPFSAGLRLGHNQDLSNNEINLTLPDFNANMNNIYPFRGKSGSSNTWYQKLALRWTMTGRNELTNNLGRIGSDVSQDSISNFNSHTIPTLWENSRKGMRHTIPIATSLKVLKYFTLTPSFNYNERWYFDKLEWHFDETDSVVAVKDTVDGFNRAYDYNMGAGLNTRIYGIYNFKKGSVQAIRHVMNPSVSFTYRPDFAREKFDFYQRVEDPTNEEYPVVYKSRHSGRNYIYGAPGAGESGSIGLSLNNNLEMKYLSKKDTTNESRKISLLNNFGLSTTYDIIADSFQLAPISMRANTSLFNNKVSINYNGTIDPYHYEEDPEGINSTGIRRDIYAWKKGQRIARISSGNLAVSTNLNPKARDKDRNLENKVRNSNLNEDQKQNILDQANNYVDFDIPWSMRLNLNLSYSKNGLAKSVYRTNLTFSGDFSLSEKWKISYNSGIDFKAQEFTRTSLGIHRDLHCWEMNLNWVPFGPQTSYNFEIRVKSALLQDLKLNKQRNFRDITF